MDVLCYANNLLGEGPVWDHTRNELLWVDIELKYLFFYHFNKGEIKRFSFDYPIGACVPVENSGKYLLALQNGLALFNRNDESLEYISNCESEIKKNRFNDGKCDPAGRFWIGSMDMQVTAGKGSLYSIGQSFLVSKKLSGLTIPNGMAWTKNGKQMFFTDTATRCVTQYDFDLETGSISNPNIVITFPENLGWPDGMCIDTEDMLWIANWGAACVTRWNPKTGLLIQKMEIPALHTSSVCFGGENMNTLYITTARTGLSDAQLTKYPLSGSVFKYDTPVTGCKSSFFKIA